MDENLDSKSWYLGQMSREDVEDLLKQDDVPPHTRLIRKSKNVPEFIISYKKPGDGDIAHRKISFQNGRYWSVRDFQFTSVVALVQYHAPRDHWVLYDRFCKSHARMNGPEPSEAVLDVPPFDYEGSSSSWDGTSLDSGAADHDTEIGSCTPLDENSMVVRLRKILQNKMSSNRGLPADVPDIRAEGIQEYNLSNAGVQANTFSMRATDGKHFTEFYGENRGPANVTVTGLHTKNQRNENTSAFPAHAVQPRIGDNNSAQMINYRNTVVSRGSQDAAEDRSLRQESKFSPADTGCSMSMRVDNHEDRSDWSLAKADVRRVDRLGAGNFGEVWKVVHVKSKKIFAMKTMKAATMKPAEFEREVKVMMTFRHPNLVKTYAVCSDPGESFILIDFLANGSVIDYSKAVRRREKNPLSVTQRYNIACDVLKGMKYLSEENLIHRDLAARNVLLADDLTAKVADFGLALLANPDGGNAGHQGPMGTPWMWTAPEALRGRNKWSTSCDVWSYGVFCWELYTNCERCPYQPEVPNSRELDQFLASGGRLKVPDSCHIAQLVTQCWTFDPHSRPSFQQLHGLFRALGPPAEL